MQGTEIGLSLVVPAFDEAERIAKPLREIGAFLSTHYPNAELVVVDDGSRDATHRIVRELAPSLGVPVQLLRCEVNRGKGHALKVGFAAARGERILFSDADLSTPIAEAPRLLDRLAAGADIVIGSRKTEGAEIAIRQPWLRETMGKCFTYLTNFLIGPASDVTCGFKAFRGEVGRDLFSRLRIDGWAFDAELLWLAHRGGHRIDEVPVRWEDREGTKVSLASAAAKTLVELLRIRWLAMRGVYDAPVEPSQPSEARLFEPGL